MVDRHVTELKNLIAPLPNFDIHAQLWEDERLREGENNSV